MRIHSTDHLNISLWVPLNWIVDRCVQMDAQESKRRRRTRFTVTRHLDWFIIHKQMRPARPAPFRRRNTSPLLWEVGLKRRHTSNQRIKEWYLLYGQHKQRPQLLHSCDIILSPASFYLFFQGSQSLEIVTRWRRWLSFKSLVSMIICPLERK